MTSRASHHGRTTSATDPDAPRPRKRSVTVTAWIVVAGLVLTAFAPILAILLGS
jgi:hypothetical protein